MKYLLFLLSSLILSDKKASSQDTPGKQKPVYYFNPRWSPDGSSILFESTLTGESNIYTISKDGSGLNQITRKGGGQAAWSPEGSKIVYYRKIFQDLQLFTNAASGGVEKRLLETNTQDYGPGWSHDGLIVFMSNPSPLHIAHFIYTVKIDGTGLRRITDTAFDCMTPQWSPDGKKILFVRGEWTSKTYKTISPAEMQALNRSTEIMVMNADGSGIRRIARNDSRFKNPVWSSEGKGIFVKRDLDSVTEIYRLNKRGKRPVKICQINKKIGSFDVSPGGEIIVFEYGENKKYAIYTFNIRTKNEQKIVGDGEL